MKNSTFNVSDQFILMIIQAVKETLANKDIPITARVAIAEKYIETINFTNHEN